MLDNLCMLNALFKFKICHSDESSVKHTLGVLKGPKENTQYGILRLESYSVTKYRNHIITTFRYLEYVE